MFILNWIRQWREMQLEFAEKKRELNYCESCEVLKLQLAMANEEKQQLLDRILNPVIKPESKLIDTPNLKPLMPTSMSWSARRQMLEAEDRAKARALRNNDAVKVSNSQSRVSNPLSIPEIERELGVSEG